MLKNKILDFLNFFFAPRSATSGVQGFKDGKFYLIFAAYALSFLIFSCDPFFKIDGAFVYQQGVITIFLAFVLASTWNWEYHWFGRSSGANFLLQIFQIFPLTLFLARAAASPGTPEPPESFLGITLKGFWIIFDKCFGDLLKLIPQWICDIFANYQVTLLLILILAIFCIRKLYCKAGALLCIFVFLIGSAASRGAGSCFWGGLLLFGGGMALQFCRYDRIVYYENIIRRIRSSGDVEPLSAAVILRSMQEIARDGNITEPQLLSLVKSEYAKDNPLSDNEIKTITREITRKMLYEYHITEMHQDNAGPALTAHRNILRQENLLAAASMVPRAVFAVILAVIWALIPVDLIPDVIPFLGTLDDVAIALFSAVIVKDIAQK